MKKLIYSILFSFLIFSIHSRHEKKSEHESLPFNPRRYPRKYNSKYNPEKFEQQDDFGYYPVYTKRKKSHNA